MKLTSSAFSNNQPIPKKHTCEGANISPPIKWTKGPNGTRTYVIICDYPNTLRRKPWVHWIVYNIPATVTTLKENSDTSFVGENDFNKVGYGGPCPPVGHGKHRYFFKLYSLDVRLPMFFKAPTKDDIVDKMRGHILKKATLVGTYERKQATSSGKSKVSVEITSPRDSEDLWDRLKGVTIKDVEINKMIDQVSSHIKFNEIYSSKVFEGWDVDSIDIYYPKNWLVATSKRKHCLMVFDKSNLKLLGTFGKNGKFNRPNGICIVDNLCFVVERDNKRVQVLKLPSFKTVSTFGNQFLKLPYGIDVKKEGNKRYVVFISDSPAINPKIYKLIFDSKRFKIDRTFLIDDVKKVESISYDPIRKKLYYADEIKKRMYGYDLEKRENFFSSHKFKDEPEGIGLYNNYLIQVEQSNENKFHVYEREGMKYLGYFTGNFTKNTDGIRMSNDGKLFAVDDDKRISCFDFKNGWEKSNLLVSYRSVLDSIKKNEKTNTSMFNDLKLRKDINTLVGIWVSYEPPSKEKATWIFKRFIRLMNEIYENFVPYSINKDWEVTVKKNQKVRNCGTLHIILRLQRLVGGFSEPVMENVKNDMDYYIELYESHNKPMRQASAFLGLAIKEYQKINRHADKKYFKVQQKICEYLTKSLPKLERSFELGEVLIFLKEACPPNYSLLLSEHQKMHKEIENDGLERNNVFKYNWHAKFLFSLHSGIGYIPELRRPTEIEESVESHARFLAERLKKIVDRFVLEDVETNYLAVCLEACAALTMIDKNPFISIKQDLMPTIGKLFGELNSRINDGGLFRFLSGGSRIDITGHVIEGLLYLFY